MPADKTDPLVGISTAELRSVVPPGLLPQVLKAYNDSIEHTFYVSMPALVLYPHSYSNGTQ